MSENVVIPKADWVDILDGVREKTGKTDDLVSGQVRAEIDSISVGSEGNTLNEFLKGTKTEITAEDMAGITTIRGYAFYKTPITSVEISNSVVRIESDAFRDTNITSIVIPDNVSYLGPRAFTDCSNLKTVVISKNITNMSGAYFGGNNNAECVIFRVETPPIISSNTLTGLPSDCVIKVPAASVEAYKAAPNWIARADYITAIEEEEQ